jgi:hypothetical protein
MKCRFAALGLAGLLAGPAQADGGVAEVLRAVKLDATLAGFTETVPQTEVPDMLARLTLANQSSLAWQALDIRIEVLSADATAYQPSTRDDSIRFGLQVQPYASWRETLELRINDVYAGKPGGNWDVHFGEATESMRIRFVAPAVHPGDRIEVRFPVSDSGTQLWRLHAQAHGADSTDSAQK